MPRICPACIARRTRTQEITVTPASGMSALMLSVQALVDPGDRVAVVTPVWPNLTEIPKILGADVARVPLTFGRREWTLDLDRLIAALTSKTRLLLINSPNNPTGWTLSAIEQRAILEHGRRHGIWIIADDVYERLHYAGGGGSAACAPSFLDIATPEDRVVSTNSFSKSWLMTGFRLGWIVAPPAMLADLGKLVEYNTSCSPCFVQRAGVVAIRDGEPTVAHTRKRFCAARDFLVRELNAIPGVCITAPPGAMYAFFRVAGTTDTLSLCKRLVREAKLEHGTRQRLRRPRGPRASSAGCFAAPEARLAEGVDRLSRFLSRERRSAA